jgi:hypothetical protein
MYVFITCSILTATQHAFSFMDVGVCTIQADDNSEDTVSFDKDPVHTECE